MQPYSSMPRPPTAEERQALAAQAQQLRHLSTAAAQWAGAPDKVRRLLCAYAGLREANPGESLASIASREWAEFTQSERVALGQSTRLLMRTLARMGDVMRRWWVEGE